MTNDQRHISIRLIREQEVIRTNRNKLLRKSFGDRMPISYTAECAHRDQEIAALNETIAMLEEIEVDVSE